MTDALGDPSFLDSLGERSRRRAEPRTSVSLAGAGCALGIVGVLVLAADAGLDDNTGEFSQLPGILLSGLVVALGYFVLSAARRGSLATAGTVAAVFGVPAFMFFVTFDEDGFPPYNTEAILIVAAVVWLGSYLVGPAKGRPFFLGSGLIALWFTVLELTENVFDAPFTGLGGFFFGTEQSFEFDATGEAIDPSTGEIIDPSTGFGPSGDFDEPSFDAPDPATIGMLSLGLGIAFLVVGRWLDRKGHHGAATPFSFAAIPCLAVGVIGLADDLEMAGSGLLLVVIGLALAYGGATIWRRATSWIGGGAMALGLALFLGDMAGDNATTGGMLYIAGGIGMVFIGHLIASVIDEPDELTVTTAGPRIRAVAPSARRRADLARTIPTPRGSPRSRPRRGTRHRRRARISPHRRPELSRAGGSRTLRHRRRGRRVGSSGTG